MQEQKPSLVNEVGAFPHRMNIAFCKEQEQYEHLNSAIPTKDHSFVRVVSFNVHWWLDPFLEHEEAAVEVICHLQADILILQESNHCPSLSSSNALEVASGRFAKLKALGYDHTWDKSPKNETTFLTTIASKLPILSYKYHELVSGRFIVEAKIQLPNEDKLPVIGVHLDVYDETEDTRLKEIQQILKITQAIRNRDQHTCLLGGDFNSLRRQDYSDERWQYFTDHDQLRGLQPKHMAMDAVEKSGLFVDCFVKEELPVPQCTTWSGRRIDYLMLEKEWQYKIKGCYVYHTSVSDHVPVICDFVVEDIAD